MGMYTQPVQTLIDELGRLPGIGPKSAQRIAFHLLKVPADDVTRLASALVDAKARVRFCDRCWNIAEAALCPICADDRRDGSLLCVVESPADVVAIEQSGGYRGRYFVLMGHLSPLDGIGPEQLGVRELEVRLDAGGIQEVILATNPTVEGEATAHFLSELARSRGLRATRIAHGVPIGGELEYIDGGTLAHALAGRQSLG